MIIEALAHRGLVLDKLSASTRGLDPVTYEVLGVHVDDQGWRYQEVMKYRRTRMRGLFADGESRHNFR